MSVAKTVTDDSGEFLITFRRVSQQGIRVKVNQNARLDVTLSVGQVSESISVKADAIGVDTPSSTGRESGKHCHRRST